MKKHTATPEQLAEREAKKARFRALVKRIAEMPEAERLALAAQAGGITSVSGHPLSMKNSLLLIFQRQGVTIVGGFRQWLAAGRCVRKGEKALSLWIPTGGKQDDAGPAASDDPVDGETEGASPRFIIGNVFDISQTDEANPA